MRKWLIAFWNVITFPFRLIYIIFRFLWSFPGRLKQGSARIHKFLTEEPEDTPLPDTFAKVTSQPMGIFEHLDALRKHLLRAAGFTALMVLISFGITPRLISILAEPVGGLQALVAIEVTEPISVFMRVSIMTGVAIALPYIAFEAWLFIAPGLHPRSRIMGLLGLPAVLVLFASGAAFAYFIMLPAALPILLNFMNIKTDPRPSSYINFVTSVIFWVGILFEFPLVIYILASLGWVKAKMLSDQWRVAIVIIAIVAAAITPTVDPVSMSLVMAPMILLYFLSIGLAYVAQRRRSTQLA
jgi:sec-independent protein translocase protein TatC